MTEQIKRNLEPLGLILNEAGGDFSVYSESAESVSLHILDDTGTGNVLHQLPLERREGGIWGVSDERLTARHQLRAARFWARRAQARL